MRYLVGLNLIGEEEDYIYVVEAQNDDEMWLKLGQRFYNVETPAEAKEALEDWEDVIIGWVYNMNRNRLIKLNQYAYEWRVIE